MKLVALRRGFIARPTHDRPAALRQADRTFPERGIMGGGTPLPASLFFSSAISVLFPLPSVLNLSLLPCHRTQKRIVASRPHKKQHRKRQPHRNPRSNKSPPHHPLRLRRHRCPVFRGRPRPGNLPLLPPPHYAPGIYQHHQPQSSANADR